MVHPHFAENPNSLESAIMYARKIVIRLSITFAWEQFMASPCLRYEKAQYCSGLDHGMRGRLPYLGTLAAASSAPY